ncbi:Sialate O-acetylesterase [Hymenobacter roseosalivarius DSM 11622]|uniref:Sialate O-acetylesterase n=1 Tax=Hymenobacter roseosalivarius DSM 11622 TaxID=645990 RepID=A0A1W1UI25_9BACT|nr:sialate O-acetylesterase [Hymenobacter roseosalivarius]SMB80768.1 Sialate O-acetylesterase [Hymenobacter roseosalivarius DSM 11622]
MKYLFLLAAVAAGLLAAPRARAKIRLPALIGPNMVVQQRSQAPLWGWARPGSAVSVLTSWDQKTYAAKGDAQGRWRVKVATPGAGGPYSLTFSDGEKLTIGNVLVGEVWVCSGQSNMEMPMRGFNSQPILNGNEMIASSASPTLRLFKVSRATALMPQADCKGQWDAATPETVREFSALAYQFGARLQRQLHVPVGLVLSTVGGTMIETWMSPASLQAFPMVRIPPSLDTVKAPHKAPTALFSGMIAPVVGYGIRGVIWCQGESNRHEPALYEKLFPAMVADWRQQWGQGEFPFYYLQIAPFGSTDKTRSGARLREAQLKSMAAIPNSGMASAMDVGMEKYIHFMDKTAPAQRLAYWALAKTYGIKGITYSGPVYKSLTVDGRKAMLSFDYAEYGLTSFGKPLALFEVAGADKVFYPATATIKSGKVEVASEQVAAPVAVRYAFKEFVTGDLFNNDGLPASSFRTDDW